MRKPSLEQLIHSQFVRSRVKADSSRTSMRNDPLVADLHAIIVYSSSYY